MRQIPHKVISLSVSVIVRKVHRIERNIHRVTYRYAGIRKVNTPQARANHIASEPVDQVEGLVLLEGVVILFNHTLEQDQISNAHGPRELEVRLQCFREAGLPEVGAVGDLAEQQAHQKHPLERLDAESDSRLVDSGTHRMQGSAPHIADIADTMQTREIRLVNSGTSCRQALSPHIADTLQTRDSRLVDIATS